VVFITLDIDAAHVRPYGFMARCGGSGQGTARCVIFAALVVMRFQLPHAALAVFYRVDRSTITRAVHEI